MTNTSLQRLRERLAIATAKNDAVGAREALAAIHEYLVDAGFGNDELRLTFRLWAALEDHARGKPHPLLAVTPSPGQREHVADDEFKLCTAVVVTLVSETERTGRTAARSSAIRRVAKALKEAGVPITETNIKTWHHEIVVRGRQGKTPRFLAYKDLLDQVRAKVGEGPQVAESGIRMLTRLLREKM